MKLSDAERILGEGGIEDARREARRLFAHFARLPESELYCRDAESDSPELTEAVRRRAERFPLQYIIGEVDFYRECYKVTPDCLIPRSDTEILVDEVIKRLPPEADFIDLCTGSGCIALSILKNTEKTEAVAVDVSEGALNVARENAERLGLSKRVSFLLEDALRLKVREKAFAVVSNPPYVSNSAYRELQAEIFYEPEIAFLGGEDGLLFYRKIIPLYKDALAEDGFFAFEIGYDQADAIKNIAKENGFDTEIIKDYGQNPRVAILKKTI